MFQTGKQDMTHKSGPGLTHTVTNVKNTAWVENAVHTDRCQTVCFLSIKPKMIIRTLHTITQIVGCLRVCSHCVPCLLENKYNKHHMYHWNIWSDVFLWQTVVGNQILHHHSDTTWKPHAKKTPWLTSTKEIQVKSTCQRSDKCVLWHQTMPVTGLQTT